MPVPAPLVDKQNPDLDTRARLTPHKKSNMDLGKLLSSTLRRATEMANLVQRLKMTGMSDELDNLVTNNCDTARPTSSSTAKISSGRIQTPSRTTSRTAVSWTSMTRRSVFKAEEDSY